MKLLFAVALVVPSSLLSLAQNPTRIPTGRHLADRLVSGLRFRPTLRPLHYPHRVDHRTPVSPEFSVFWCIGTSFLVVM
jgi:hypothetical protein